MEIELLIFDWSGVISDDRRPVYEANMKILRNYNKPTISFEEWLPRTTMTVVEFLINHGVYDNPEKLFALYKKYLDEVNDSGIVPTVYPDVRDTFQYLKRKEKRLAILSSHPADNLLKESENFNLTQFLDLISGSSKNKKVGLRGICNKLEIDSKHTLYVDDTIYGIQAAKNVGVYSAGICTGYHTKERLLSEKPDIILSNLSDLKYKF